LAAFQINPQAFDLVITDQTMPQMTGMALIDQLRSIRPDVPIILCTGYSDEATPEQAEQLGLIGHFYKPVNLKELAHAVQNALSKTLQS
jgi:DNA-binding NtrC family response regulator